MNKFKRLISISVCLSIFAMLLCSCKSEPEPPNPAASDAVVDDVSYIRVNDYALSKEYIGYFFYVAQLNMIKEAGMILGEGGNATETDVATFWETTEIENKSAVSVARDLAADNAVMLTVQYLRAVDEGITLTQDESDQIDKQIESAVLSEGGEEAFKQRLADMGCNLEAYKKILTENKYVEKLYIMYDASGVISVTDEELASYAASYGDGADIQLIQDMLKKEKFNQMADEWEKEYDIFISDKKMQEFNV